VNMAHWLITMRIIIMETVITVLVPARMKDDIFLFIFNGDDI